MRSMREVFHEALRASLPIIIGALTEEFLKLLSKLIDPNKGDSVSETKDKTI